MLAKLGLRPLGVATKLYFVAALLLTVTCIWALAAIRFASETEAAVVQLREEGLVNAATAARAQVFVEQQGRLVALSVAGKGEQADARKYGDISKATVAIIEQIGDEGWYPTPCASLRCVQVSFHSIRRQCLRQHP
jgi:hypothetical protein